MASTVRAENRTPSSTSCCSFFSSEFCRVIRHSLQNVFGCLVTLPVKACGCFGFDRAPGCSRKYSQAHTGGGILPQAWSMSEFNWAPTHEIHLLYVMSEFQCLELLALWTAVIQHVNETSSRHLCVVIQLKEDEIHEEIHEHEAKIDHYLTDLSISPILLTWCHWWENHAHIQGMWHNQWAPTKMWIWSMWRAWSWPTLVWGQQ